MEVKVLMFWLCVTLINVTKFVKTEHLQAWEDFKIQYGKYYATPEENQRRMKIFKDNLRKIAAHNKKFKKGKLSFKIGVNSLSDLTAEEFSARYLPNVTFSHYIEDMVKSLKDKPIQSQFNPDTSTVPESKNWVTEGAVTPVKNQGTSCGSCWAFTAAGVIESHNFIQTGKLVSLSDQNLLDCTGDVYIGGDVNLASSWMKLGCQGGLINKALDYVINNQGIETEVSYPYEEMKGPCRYRAENRGATISDLKLANSGDEDQLKSIVGLIGPVTAVISVENDFQSYRYDSGIYKSDICGRDRHNNFINHAVIVVGYGTEGNEPYWLVKNSWGPGWGLGGYFKIRRGTNECQIANFNLYPVV